MTCFWICQSLLRKKQNAFRTGGWLGADSSNIHRKGMEILRGASEAPSGRSKLKSASLPIFPLVVVYEYKNCRPTLDACPKRVLFFSHAVGACCTFFACYFSFLAIFTLLIFSFALLHLTFAHKVFSDKLVNPTRNTEIISSFFTT